MVRIFKDKRIIFLFYLLILIFFLKLSHRLRSIGYFVVPEPFLIMDEHTNVWHGLSLRKTGVPVAWSQLPAYKTNKVEGDLDGFGISISGRLLNLDILRNLHRPVVAVGEMDVGKGVEHITFVAPYIDHPPLGALVLSLGVSPKTPSLKDLSDYDMRKVSVYLGTLTGVLIFLAGWQLSKRPIVGIISSIIYGTVPSYLFLSRYAQLENVLSPLFLIVFNLILFSKKIGHKNRRLANLLILVAGFFSGLCILTKITGIFSLIFGVLMLILWKKDQIKIALFSLPALFIGSFYFLWCLYLNPDLFKNVFIFQGFVRSFVGSLNLLTVISRIGIESFPFDGWWMSGFLVLLLLSRTRKNKPLIIASLSIVVCNLFLGAANYPWYYIPLIPFLSISMAIFLKSVIDKPDFFKIFFVFFTFFSSSFYWGYGVYFATSEAFGFQQPFGAYRIALLITLILGLYWQFFSRIRKPGAVWAVFVFLVFLGIVWLNIKSVYFLSTNWGYGHYPPLYTPMSPFIMK